MKDKSIELYKKAIELWGLPSQINMYHEETAELTICLSKALRYGIPNKFHIMSEVADVEIMIEQIRVMFELDEEHFQIVKRKKLNRLKDRIDENTPILASEKETP